VVPTPGGRTAAPPSTADVGRIVDEAVARVRAHGRDDVLGPLLARRDALARPECNVLVVGEFKKGKSSLVNALLNWRICPVDPDVTTAVPTLVRWGPEPRAWAVRTTGGGEEGAETRTLEPLPPPGVGPLAQELGADAPGDGVQMLEVELPRPLLRRGLVLVDTPGVNGGLSSAHASATLRALGLADGIVFVSDARQEYTAAEVAFLARAREMCRNVVCVLTKVDVQPHWRRVRDLNRGHLARAGIDAPILPLAAPLRHWGLRTGSAELDRESGYPELTEVLLTDVVKAKQAFAVEAAARAACDALRQIEAPLAAEHATLSDPARREELLERVLGAKERAEALRSASARWSQTLADRFGDVMSNIDLDLARRLREVRREALAMVNTSDPAELWPDLEPWLYERTNGEMVAHFETIRAQAAAVGDEVAELFQQHAADADLAFDPSWLGADLEQRDLAAPEFEPQSLRDLALSAVRGAYSGSIMTGLVGTFASFAVPVLTPLAAVLAFTLGRRSFASARESHLRQQRVEAQRAVQQYLEETELVSRKASRDMLRRANQALRDHFQTRAEQLVQSAVRAVEATAQAAKADRDAIPGRVRLLDTELQRLRATLRAAEQVLATTGTPRAA